jgi:hypothetical protein
MREKGKEGEGWEGKCYWGKNSGKDVVGLWERGLEQGFCHFGGRGVMRRYNQNEVVF